MSGTLGPLFCLDRARASREPRASVLIPAPRTLAMAELDLPRISADLERILRLRNPPFGMKLY